MTIIGKRWRISSEDRGEPVGPIVSRRTRGNRRIPGLRLPPAFRCPNSSPRDGCEIPGEFPFTRGIFKNGYRGRLWTFRQYSGFGSAEETNERYKFLLSRGSTGLSVALDLPTQCGYDPDDEMAFGEVGKVGVSMFSLAEAQTVFAGIDLSKISTSFTINGTAAIIYAMYIALADKAGVPRSALTGTIQNDILKEYVARGTWIFPVRPSMRLIADTILFSNEHTPRFNPISIAGAHVRDAGATAVEEMAYTLGQRTCLRRRAVAARRAMRTASPNGSAFSFMSTWISSKRSRSFAPAADFGRSY